jgi:hypothetical protein
LYLFAVCSATDAAGGQLYGHLKLLLLLLLRGGTPAKNEG